MADLRRKLLALAREAAPCACGSLLGLSLLLLDVGDQVDHDRLLAVARLASIVAVALAWTLLLASTARRGWADRLPPVTYGVAVAGAWATVVGWPSGPVALPLLAALAVPALADRTSFTVPAFLIALVAATSGITDMPDGRTARLLLAGGLVAAGIGLAAISRWTTHAARVGLAWAGLVFLVFPAFVLEENAAGLGAILSASTFLAGPAYVGLGIEARGARFVLPGGIALLISPLFLGLLMF